MRRALRWLGWMVAVAIGVPLLLLLAVLVALNTAPGQRMAVGLINRMAGAQVALTGLHGRFPDRLRIERIALHDARGTYATIRDAALDWSPWNLLGRDVAIRRLAAGEVAVLRRPVAATSGAGTGSPSSVSLPVRVDIDRLRVERLVLATPVAGAAVTLALDGAAHLASLHAGRAEIALHRLDAPGSYRLAGRIDDAGVTATVTADEPAGGFIASVASLPGLGALSVQASLDGPWSGAVTRVAVAAGLLRLDAHGRIDITHEAADLDLAATAPAMSPRPGVSWQSIDVTAHVRGPLAAPEGSGRALIAALQAGGAGVGRLAADFAASAGHAEVSATAEGIRLPGPKPALLAAAPLTLHADADLTAAGRPVRFALAHPLLTLAGTAGLAGTVRAQAHLDLPDLAPLADAVGARLAGHAALDLTAAEAAAGIDATASGTVGITSGLAPLPALVGPDAHIDAAASLHGSDVAVSKLEVNASHLSLAAHGGLAGGRVVTLDWQAALPDLAALLATVHGSLRGKGHVSGPTDDLTAQADLTGEIATAGVPRGPLTVSLTAQGLPDRPSGRIAAHGLLDGADLALDATAQRTSDGALRVAISRADWKSAHADGAFTLGPQAALPAGSLAFSMKRLADLSRLLGTRLAGSIAASAEIDGHGTARLRLDAREAGLEGTASVATARLGATIRDPLAAPEVDATLDVTGLRAGTLAGDARLAAQGRASALGLRAQATVQGLGGAALQANAGATLDLPARRLTLSALQADWHSETLRLLAPVRIDFADAIAVDRLRLGLRQAVLEVAGRVSPTLDLTASLHDLRAELANAFVQGLMAQGVLNADARLTGTPAQPRGRVRIAATGLRVHDAKRRANEFERMSVIRDRRRDVTFGD